MTTITFLWAVHNHQPVGNFDAVLERVYAEAYAPFLDVLAAHPDIRIALHLSGCLLDWLEARRPEYVDHVGTLVERGQIELLTGGYYEPILSAIPEEDRLGQIAKLSERLQRRFGRRPTGMWVAERVWEPALAGSLARAGVRYTFLDDAHFLAAGLPPESLHTAYRTEDLGQGVAVYPISKRLRYLIPFRPPEEGIAWLLERAQAHPGGTVTLGDDGEKFGHWPRTYGTVYTEKWLDRFFGLLGEHRDRIRMLFPADALAESPPVERVYLPIASYEEMMEWTLPESIAPAAAALRSRLLDEGDPAVGLVRGGMWRTYLARYPESDHMHKRGLALGREVAAMRGADPAGYDRARDALWSAQCNCAYWHGVFGGIYLPHLRDAVYQGILEAEELLERSTRREPWVLAERIDLDADGEREILLRNSRLTLVLDPARGGALNELSVKPERLALGNGLSRRREAYHARIAEARASRDDGDGVHSIHDRLESKESDLDRHLTVDRYRRVSLVDHLLAPEATLESFRRGELPTEGDFEHAPYRSAVTQGVEGSEVVLRRTGEAASGSSLTLEKRLVLLPRAPRFEVHYRLENPGRTPLRGWFGTEWNFGMLEGRSEARGYRLDGVASPEDRLDSTAETGAVHGVGLFDRARGFEIALTFSEPARLWRAPVETVSLSEGGLERIYQSSALFPHWTLALEPGEVRTLTVTFAFTARR